MTTSEAKHRPTAVHTVSELLAFLQKLPGDMPISQGFDPGVMAIVFNQSSPEPHLAFEDNDGTWDDDEGDE